MLNVTLQQNYPLSAINYYRLMWPIAYLIGLDASQISCYYQFLDQVPIGNQRLHELLSSDMLLLHSTTAMYMYNGGPRALQIQDAEPWLIRYKDGEYNIKPSPALIVDTDDDFLATEVTNNYYREVGSRAFGKELQDFDRVMGTYPQPDGSKEDWVLHGPGCENPEGAQWVPSKGRYRQRQLKYLLGNAAGNTYSSERLQKKMEAWSGSQGFFFPNCVWEKIYKDYAQAELPKEPAILWTGGSSHYLDLGEIARPLAALVKKYEKSRMMVFGQEFKWFNELFPPERFTYVEWLPAEAYWARTHTLGHNINLCPLQDTEFNWAKTAIKWYESSAIPNPAATLAKRVGPFADEIEDGVTGFLYTSPEEFAEKLEILMTQPEVRERLARNAHDWVWKHRNLAVWAPKLMGYWTDRVHAHVEWVKETHAAVATEL